MTNFGLLFIALGASLVFLAIGLYTSEGTLTPNLSSRRYKFARFSAMLGIALLLLAGVSALHNAMEFNPSR